LTRLVIAVKSAPKTAKTATIRSPANSVRLASASQTKAHASHVQTGPAMPKTNANPVPGTAKNAQTPILAQSVSQECSSTRLIRSVDAPQENSSPVKHARIAAKTVPNALRAASAPSVNPLSLSTLTVSASI